MGGAKTNFGTFYASKFDVEDRICFKTDDSATTNSLENIAFRTGYASK